MRTILATIVAASLLTVAACGDDRTAPPDTLPPVTDPVTTEPSITNPSGPDQITIDDIEIDPDAAPAGPLFGNSAASESANQSLPGESVCVEEGDCEPDVVEPPDTFVPLPAHQPFCELLADMEQRPFPDDDFEQLVVAQSWFAELRLVTPDEIAQPFDEVVAFVDEIVATQDVDFEPAEGSDVIVAIETIGEFIDTSC